MVSIMKKIVICEDHQIVIDGLRSIFEGHKEYVVIDCVTNALDLLKSIEKNKTDIILLDLNLPGKNGIEILKEIKQKWPLIKIIILTMYNNESIIKETIKHKANGYLLKNCSSTDLFEALEQVYSTNKFYLGDGVKKVITKTLFENEDSFFKKIKITRREKEIITELIQGSNVPQIAGKLFISTHTVEAHKKNIFKKLDIHNSMDLMKFANESNLLS